MIHLTELVVGTKTIRIPVAILTGGNTGKTLLITAGNDGDEYAGITAAYRIIEHYSHAQFSGTLIVIPIVNIPGFENETSLNPLDGKYPKHIFPGTPNGTPSERIRFWLSDFVRQSDLWMDLHGASLTECITPYIHTWRSSHRETDDFIFSLLQKFSVQHAVFQRYADFVRRPKKNDCGYCMCESNSVDDHTNWIHTSMIALGLLSEKSQQVDKKIWTDVVEYTLRKSGIWYADFSSGKDIKKGSILGVVKSLDGKIIETITAKQDGVILWGKVGMRANSGDVVAGVGVI